MKKMTIAAMRIATLSSALLIRRQISRPSQSSPSASMKSTSREVPVSHEWRNSADMICAWSSGPGVSPNGVT